MPVGPLPPYPSTQVRKSLSASQLAHFHSNVASTLAEIAALPPAKRDTQPTRLFISTYASDAAHQVLQRLIWESSEPLRFDEQICQRVLILAEQLASSLPDGLDLRTILDLSVAFPTRSTRLKAILAGALKPSLPSTFAVEVVPAFTIHLNPAGSSGLYALRKTAHCLLSLLRPCPPELVRPFVHNKEFVLALARAYDEGLTSISRSYGGIRDLNGSRTIDDWERVWIETKVDLIDAFHVLLKRLVTDLSTASGSQATAEADRTFGLVNAMLEISPAFPSTQRARDEAVDGGETPFLDRPLLADYQHAYDLNGTLSSVLRNIAQENTRIQALDAALRSFGPHGERDPGALKLVLKSSGRSPPVQLDGRVSVDKGKARASSQTTVPVPEQDPEIDVKVVQVLDIFPDLSPGYVRKMLEHPSYPFRGSAEKVIEALLEGTAPNEAALGSDVGENLVKPIPFPPDPGPIMRRNIFDNEDMDFSRVRLGKKKIDETIFTQSKAESEHIKTDILRRFEIMNADDDSDGDRSQEETPYLLDDDFGGFGNTSVKIAGDGEGSGEDDDEDSPPARTSPETILELAYIRDPKLFNRDAETRRSKARADLKAQTGWIDEQIEGWRVMLERNPKKERILQKHEFAGNSVIDMAVADTSNRPHGPPGARGRGGKRGGGGRGQGRGRGGGDGDGGSSRDRALKDKHKASFANHNRKRENDRKMAKSNAGPSG